MNKLERQKLEAAILKGAELFVKHGLGDWKIKLNNKTKILAQTDHDDKTIAYSKRFLIVATEDEFVGVSLHEATHALLGPGKGHDEEFIDLCTKISPNKLYACEKAPIVISKYVATCPTCKDFGGVGKNVEAECIECWRADKYSRLIIEENKLEVKLW